ncbi:uncharacterized protein LOC124254564 [Haliotis rubra]|uniref:uncharacterized protein LOC124254564 n=1 Tax=Haliotis rubra TaxID=36100 RepID=UPI001EE5C5E2|nr:uncharacterized protein LOC124254564 [Haliotis rubra]
MLTSADSLEFDKSDKPPDVMQMSVESAAWSSMGSSGLSKSSQETIRSQSDSSHSHDLMQVSAESAEFKYKHKMTEEKSQIIEQSYTHKSESQTKTHTTEVRHVSQTSYDTNPFLETEEEYESYEQYNKEQNFKFDMEPTVSSSPFLSHGPYQEKKKVFTMAEWEAMKQSKKNKSPSPEMSPPRDPAPTSSHPVSDHSSSPTSQPHIGLATSETSDSSRAAHGEEEEEGDPDLMEGDDSIGSMNSSLTTSVDGAESTKLMLKKEIHMKTTIGPDGREQTMVKEDIQVRQENDPPEELRDSMQEIINQFMVSEMPQQRQALEDDV